jgi:hypothetical protein
MYQQAFFDTQPGAKKTMVSTRHSTCKIYVLMQCLLLEYLLPLHSMLTFRSPTMRSWLTLWQSWRQTSGGPTNVQEHQHLTPHTPHPGTIITMTLQGQVVLLLKAQLVAVLVARSLTRRASLHQGQLL